MKIVALLLLAASVTSAAVPFAIANSCATSPPRDEFPTTQPVMPPGTYVHVSTAAPLNNGVWSERNGQDGLQVNACIIGGIQFHARDAKTLV